MKDGDVAREDEKLPTKQRSSAPTVVPEEVNRSQAGRCTYCVPASPAHIQQDASLVATTNPTFASSMAAQSGSLAVCCPVAFLYGACSLECADGVADDVAPSLPIPSSGLVCG